MHKFAYVAAWLLTLGGGVLVAATATYAVWLWTDPSWAYVKFLAFVLVGGPVIAVIANALFNYAARASA